MTKDKEKNNAHIDIINLDISFTADFDGFVHISADYCDLELPNNDCAICAGDSTIIKIRSGETVRMSNVVGLKLLKFEYDKT